MYIRIMTKTKQVFQLLKDKLESANWKPGERMPSLASLAAAFSVSRATMWKALVIAKKDLLIHTTPRGSIHAGASGSFRIESSHKGLAWQRLKTSIGRDIISGRFHGSGLPPSNKLALQYRAGIRTIKKALHQLVKEGLIASAGRGFSLVPHQIKAGQSTIAFVSEGTSERGIFVSDYRTKQLVESFERECVRTGLAPRSVEFNFHDANSLIAVSSIVKSLDNVAGFLVNFWNPITESYLKRWVDLIQFLAGRNVPIIVIDQAGDSKYPESILRNRWCRILRIAGERAGEMVAHALIQRGHQRIAYVTSYPSLTWAQARYTGLNRCMQQYGGSQATVDLCTFGENADPLDLTLAMYNLKKKDMLDLYRERTSSDQLEELAARIDRKEFRLLKEKLPAIPARITVERIARFLTELVRVPHDRWAYDYMITALMHIASNSVYQQYPHPLFSRALERSAATAWVCSEDATAIAAVPYLESHGKKVPADISVVGFNNWDPAYEAQLSTYDFNMNGMILESLILIRDEKTFKNKPVISEVDGYVVERRTTRR
jgi:DNA-binding LacI/PurR family transcriptional regulator/DNA-binding GntR family transcriptional regulator